MIYCMADIHGEYDRFLAMLKKIGFSDHDTLYIIGDVIDRCPGGVDILRLIMASPNMIMLLGNHEKMCLDTLGPHSTFGSRELWQYNGGDCTYTELVHMSSPSERAAIMDYLLHLPDQLDINVHSRQFHLVHGCPSEHADERIWNRPDTNALAPSENCTAIVGHTPTCYFTSNYEEPFQIWHGNRIIGIDCGCGHKSEHRRLACLRLDDMAEFYI